MNKSLTLLGLDPLVLGTSGTFPLHFFATYSLPEVSSYIGIMPLMGVVGLLARRHRRDAESGRWWIWYAVSALGLVLTWGGFTPLGHVFFHLPLFNRQRLLARNLLEVDLAVAVLFATWVDHMLLSPTPADRRRRVDAPDGDARPSPAGGAGLPGPTGGDSDIVLPLIPPARGHRAAGRPPGRRDLVPPFPARARQGDPVVAVAARRLPHHPERHRGLGHGGSSCVANAWPGCMPRLLAVLVIADLLVFNGFIQGAPDPDGATVNSATANALASFVAAQGQGPAGEQHRVALFDPDRYYSVAGRAHRPARPHHPARPEQRAGLRGRRRRQLRPGHRHPHASST